MLSEAKSGPSLIGQQLDREYLNCFQKEKEELRAAARELRLLQHFDHQTVVRKTEERNENGLRRFQLRERIYSAPAWSPLVMPIIFS